MADTGAQGDRTTKERTDWRRLLVTLVVGGLITTICFILGWWWVVGSLWYFYPRPIYPSPDPYIPPAAFVQPAPRDVWYYCDRARAYYPYVQSCPGGWRMVPANPAPPYRP